MILRGAKNPRKKKLHFSDLFLRVCMDFMSKTLKIRGNLEKTSSPLRKLNEFHIQKAGPHVETFGKPLGNQGQLVTYPTIQRKTWEDSRVTSGKTTHTPVAFGTVETYRTDTHFDPRVSFITSFLTGPFNNIRFGTTCKQANS